MQYTIASFLLAALVPAQQVHAQCASGNALFPGNGDALRGAAAEYCANPGGWTGTYDGVNYGSINEWCTRRVKNMRNVFKDQSTCNPDISGWDTSRVTQMNQMFSEAAAFDGDISGWDTAKVKKMQSMFQGATSFNQDLAWDTSSATDMLGMFQRATAFNGDISGWNTTAVTDMAFMFDGTEAFNRDLSGAGGWDTSLVASMRSMFRGATAFNGDISGFNVASVTTMKNMFKGAAVFNQDLNGAGWDTSSVTTMDSMFEGAATFNGDVSGWSTAAVTDMSSMFAGAAAFNQDLNGAGGWDTSRVTTMQRMFNGATVFNGDISGFDVASVTAMQFMFGGATAFNVDISGWFTVNAENLSFMFRRARSFNQDLSGWDLSSATTMESMFEGARSFNQNLCLWNAGLDFPYSSATDIFTNTACTFDADPVEGVAVPFCGNDCEPTSEPSSEPSSAPSCSPSSAPTEAPSKPLGVNLFYPLWTNGYNGCRNDGEEPDFMAVNPTDWLSSTMEACCKRFFGGLLYLTCMGRYPPDQDDCNMMLFYPDWNGSNKGCVDDGNEPSYMLSNHQYFLSNTREECCEKFYGWNYYSCTGTSPKLTNGEYYPDWSGSSTSTCLNDDKMPIYMLMNQAWYLSTTLEKCCKKHFSWDVNECLGTAAGGSNEWYVSYVDNTCVQDCSGASPCGGIANSWEELFSSKEKCCEEKLYWIPKCRYY